MTATATKKRGRPRKADNRQKEISDEEGKPLNGADRITELDRLGIELDNVRTKRIELNEEEGRVQQQVAEVMKKHDLTTYPLPNVGAPVTANPDAED